MAKGRKKTPGAISELKGNPGRRPRGNNPRPASAVKGTFPACPDFLTPEAKIIWGRIHRDWANLGMVSETDTGLLGAYCEAEALHNYAVKKIKAERSKKNGGYFYETENGNLVQSPWVAIKNKQALLMVKLASEFGFSPAARAKVELPNNAGTGGATPGALADFRRRREQKHKQV